MGGGDLFFGFCEVVVEWGGGEVSEEVEGGGDEGVAVLGFGFGGDGEEAFAGGVVPGEGGDFEGEAGVFAEFAVEA